MTINTVSKLIKELNSMIIHLTTYDNEHSIVTHRRVWWTTVVTDSLPVKSFISLFFLQTNTDNISATDHLLHLGGCGYDQCKTHESLLLLLPCAFRQGHQYRAAGTCSTASCRFSSSLKIRSFPATECLLARMLSSGPGESVLQ